ncbi:hypothetical protein [Novosphingobium sp. JCM 18896]|uniref:hypothetical protein n=1 Tax=Novosphingobium sp. JCM 18896 TaxID=2989731 RepID=UPI0022233BB8|nr:hypothetical protein [Novosphingobium sp. JCM 18896]MCW1430021.1 hypothetical protein [Novosphingobium sp. JCM 18896]
MGWIVEAIVNLIWDEWIYRTYQRHGMALAIVAAIAPMFLLATLIGLAILLLL